MYRVHAMLIELITLFKNVTFKCFPTLGLDPKDWVKSKSGFTQSLGSSHTNCDLLKTSI